MKLLVGVTYNELYSYLAALQPDDVIDLSTATLVFKSLKSIRLSPDSDFIDKYRAEVIFLDDVSNIANHNSS